MRLISGLPRSQLWLFAGMVWLAQGFAFKKPLNSLPVRRLVQPVGLLQVLLVALPRFIHVRLLLAPPIGV